MKKLKLTKSEIDAVWNLATSGMSKICNNALPRQQRKHPHPSSRPSAP